MKMHLPRLLLLTLLMATIPAAPAWSQACVDHPTALQPAGDLATASPWGLWSVAFKGDLGLLSYDDRVETVDLSAPESSSVQGTLVTTATVVAVADAPGLPSHFVGVESDRFVAWVMDGAGQPSEAGAVALPAPARDLATDGSVGVVAAGADGIHIVYFANPASPVVVITAPTLAPAQAVAMGNNYIYVATDAGLEIYYLDLFVPIRMGTLDRAGACVGLALDGDRIWLSRAATGLELVDVSVRTAPSLVWSEYAPGRSWMDPVVDGDRVCIGDRSDTEIWVYDTTVPDAPKPIHVESDVGDCYAAGAANGALIMGGLGGGRVYTHNQPEPAVASLTLAAESQEMLLNGDLAYVAMIFGAGVDVVDLSNPAAPVVVHTLPSYAAVFGMDLTPGHLLVADGFRMDVYDLVDPAEPAFVGRYDPADWVVDVAVEGGLAYVARNAAGVDVVTLSNPAAPVLLTTLDTPGFAVAVAVDGDLLCVADDSGGVQVVDVSQPFAPSIVATIPSGDKSKDVALFGGHVYVADDRGGLSVWDLTMPAAPVHVATFPTGGATLDLHLARPMLFTADLDAGYRVFDVLHPGAPELLGTGWNVGRIRSIAGSADHLVVSAQTDTALVVMSPQCYDLSAAPAPLAQATLFRGAVPNPFNPRTEIRFTARAGEAVTVRVFDLRGRRVAEVYRGEPGAGQHGALWNGRDGEGRDVASGTYLVEVRAGLRRQTGKVVLMR